MVYVEAMASGLAVVAPGGGGVEEVIVHGRTGLLVPPGDAEALAATLRDLLLDPKRGRALGAAARREVESRYTTERAIDRIEAAYEAARARNEAARARIEAERFVPVWTDPGQAPTP